MNTDYLEEAAKEVMADQGAVEEVQSELAQDTSHLEHDEEIPSFLDDDSETNSPLIDETESEDTEVSEVPETPQTLRYTADGQEFEASIEDAKKALSLAKGAKKAFTNNAKLRRKVKQIESQIEDLSQYKTNWEEVMKSVHSPEELYQKLTGESFEDRVDREIQRRQLYNNASPAERQLFDYEDRFQKMQAEQERLRKESETRLQQTENRASEARKSHLSSMLEPAFHQVTANLEENVGAAQANKIKRALWRESIEDVKEAVKRGYKPSAKLVGKIFERNAGILIGNNSKAVEAGVQQELKSREEVAKEKAQVASTQNYSGAKSSNKELVGKNPLDLFHHLTKG